MVVVPRRLAIKTFLAAGGSVLVAPPWRVLAQGRGEADAGVAGRGTNRISKAEFARYFERGKRRIALIDRRAYHEGDFTFRVDEAKMDHQNPYILVRSKDGSFSARIAVEGSISHRKKIDFGFVPPGEGGGESGILEFRIYGGGPGFGRERISFDSASGRHVREIILPGKPETEYGLAAGTAEPLPGMWGGEPVEEKGWNARLYNYAGREISQGGAEFGGYVVEFVTKMDALAFSFMDSCANPPSAAWEFDGEVPPQIPGRRVWAKEGIRRYAILGKTLGEAEPDAGAWVLRPENLGAFSQKKCIVVAEKENVLVFHDSGQGYGLRIIGRAGMPAVAATATGPDAISGASGEGGVDMGYAIEGETMKIVLARKGAASGSGVSLIKLSSSGKSESAYAILE